MRFVCFFHWIIANLMQPIKALAAAAGANQKRAKPPGDQSEDREGGLSGSRLVTMKLRSDVTLTALLQTGSHLRVARN